MCALQKYVHMFRLLFSWHRVALVALYLGLVSNAQAQVVNGDFSAGGAGWTTTVPTNSTLSFAGNELTVVSDDDGGANSQTFATQSLTTTDPGFLTWELVSYTSTDRDLGAFDFPIVIVGGAAFRVTAAGGIQTGGAGAIDNDDTGIANVTIRTTLGVGTSVIGAGVESQDSGFGPGIAIWDDIDFQEITQSPPGQNTIENTPLSLSGLNALSTATNNNAVTTITLSVTSGILNLGSPGAVTITGGADGTSTVTFTGSAADINTALDGLIYTPNLNFTGSDTLVFTANGGGVSDTDNIPLNVTPGTRSITVTKTASVDTNVPAGVTVTYTYVVTNNGDQVISNISLSDAHNGSGPPPSPNNETLTTDAGSVGDSIDASVDGVWDTLGPGDQVTFTASYVVTQNDVDTLL